MSGARAFPPDVRMRPVIFSAESVRAVLSGAKTQTREVLGADLPFDAPARFTPCDHLEGYGFFDTDQRWHRCPFGRPGDRLWVKEAWRTQVDFHDEQTPAQMCGAENLLYDADADWSLNKTVGRLRSPIHMPRWASRLTLEVVSVRVERLQALTEADAKAEGVQPGETTDGDLNHALGFIDAWDALNAKRGHGWDANPWVWVVEFKKVEEAPV